MATPITAKLMKAAATTKAASGSVSDLALDLMKGGSGRPFSFAR
jgi:hypothetical protein